MFQPVNFHFILFYFCILFLFFIWFVGASWKVPNRGNQLEDRLVAGEIVKTQYVPSTQQDSSNDNEVIECLFTVQEGIHCMIGPGFMENC